MKQNNARRIYIFGAMGSGKTTLAKKISKKLHLISYDLDDIYWKIKYDIHRSDKECKKLLKEITKKKEWIIEGCFSRWIEPAMRRSQLIVYLDPPFLTLLYRMFKRFLIRKLRRSEQHKDKWKDHIIMTVQNYQFTSQRHMLKNQEGWAHKKRKLLRYFIEKHKIPHIFLRNSGDVKRWLQDTYK